METVSNIFKQVKAQTVGSVAGSKIVVEYGNYEKYYWEVSREIKPNRINELVSIAFKKGFKRAVTQKFEKSIDLFNDKVFDSALRLLDQDFVRLQRVPRLAPNTLTYIYVNVDNSDNPRWVVANSSTGKALVVCVVEDWDARPKLRFDRPQKIDYKTAREMQHGSYQTEF